MTRMNIDIDDALVTTVMRRYGVSTREEAVALALRHAAHSMPTRADMLALQGTGWDGNLDELRQPVDAS